MNEIIARLIKLIIEYKINIIIFQIKGSQLPAAIVTNKSEFDLTIKQVSVTEYYYPEFSLPDFLSNLGGTLGLWLGVGVLQLGGYGILLLKELMSKFNTEKSRHQQINLT